MEREPKNGPIPADAHGTRSELVPELVGDDRDVLELDRRGSGSSRRETHDDLRGGARIGHLAEDPGHPDLAWPVAFEDLAAGVALQLVVDHPAGSHR